MKSKQDIQADSPWVGSWVTFGNPAITEILARAGFDFLVVDMEHSMLSMQEAQELIRITDLSGLSSLVRLSSNNAEQIKRVMDAGAHGVIVPMVNSKSDAEKAIQNVYYPPRGIRGTGLARAQGYGTDFEGYRRRLSDESWIIAQIEHVDGVENLDAILSLSGIDGFIVGPYDLSASLGIPGEFSHPKMCDAMAEIGKRLPDYFGGFHVVQPDPDAALEKLREGYKFLAYSVDFLLLGNAVREGLKKIRKGII